MDNYSISDFLHDFGGMAGHDSQYQTEGLGGPSSKDLYVPQPARNVGFGDYVLKTKYEKHQSGDLYTCRIIRKDSDARRAATELLEVGVKIFPASGHVEFTDLSIDGEVQGITTQNIKRAATIGSLIVGMTSKATGLQINLYGNDALPDSRLRCKREAEFAALELQLAKLKADTLVSRPESEVTRLERHAELSPSHPSEGTGQVVQFPKRRTNPGPG